MKQVLLFCSLIICFMAMAISPARIPLVKATDGLPQLSESVMVEVNCTAGSVTTVSELTSSNGSLVHFPSGVDLSNADLTNVTTIGVMFSTAQSYLMYLFNNTDATTARSIADGFTPSISLAFSTSFVWSSTGTSDGSMNVTYAGAGKSNLPSYVEGLASQCLAADLEGFSLTFEPMSHELGAYTAVTAEKDPGGFDWTCSMMTAYATAITAGSDSHLVDVLDLLDVDSLAPSQYSAEVEIGYYSQVVLTISSDSVVSYVSSQPENVTSQTERGWFLYPTPPANTLMAWFYFGSSPTPQSPLTLTFSGTVVPELTTIALLVLFLVSATVALVAKKRLSK